MKKILCTLILTFLFILTFIAGAFAEGNLKTVTVQGSGVSQSEALKDALRNGVEQRVGTLVESQTLVENLEVVTDEIYTKSQGFVQNYTILSQKEAEGQVILTVRVTINTAPDSALMNKLQKLKLIHLLSDPRIGVIIPEYHLNRFIPDPAGETAVIRQLREAGFTKILDHRQIQANRYRNIIKALDAGNSKQALALATKYHLDYLVIGEGFSEYVGDIQGSGIISCRARVEARILKVDTGEIIAANGFQLGGVDITESAAAKAALNNAGEALGDYLVEQLMNYAGSPDQGLQLVIKGVPSFSQISILERNLQALRGMGEIYTRDYNTGIATIDLNYSGSAKGLAAALENLPDISLEVTEITNSTVEAVIKY